MQGVRLLSCNYLSPGMPQGAYKVCVCMEAGGGVEVRR